MKYSIKQQNKRKILDKNENYDFKDLSRLSLKLLFNFIASFAALINAVSGFEVPIIRT